MTLNSKIQLWAPNILEETGGIQTFSKFLLLALRKVRPNVSLEVLLLHDKEPHPIEGITPLCFGNKRNKTIRKITFAAKALSSLIFNKADLIIATHIHFGALARIVGFLTHTPYWLVAHGVDAWDLTPMRMWGAKGAEKILSVSKFTTNQMQRLPGGLNLCFLDFPNTFAQDRYFPIPKDSALLSKYGLSTNSKIILTVGRLSSSEKYKGHDLIIKAIKDVARDVSDVHYLIVGSGDDQDRLIQLAKQQNVEDRVHFTGFVPDDDLPLIYNLCDVFAMPSRGEGFGIVYLEALACGKPCIASSLDGGQDALLGGELGELVDINESGALTKVLVNFLSSSKDEEAVIRRDKVIKYFGFNAFCERLNDAFCNSKKDIK